jgi:hypothetical protein
MKRKKKSIRKKKSVTFIAVVFQGNAELPIMRSGGTIHGDYGSFVGADREAVVAAALKARQEWTRDSYGPYRILVGTLTEEVITPTQYQVVKL